MEGKTRKNDALSAPARPKDPDTRVETAGADAALDTVRSVSALAVPENVALENVTSPDFAAELGSIDFANMIGGPLQACVKAQVAASLATVNFIKEVGFTASASDPTKSELIMADFTHKNGNVDNTVQAPLISMLQVPSLRIEFVEIDFNVKLNSVETANATTDVAANAGASGGFGRVKFNVSASFRRSSTSGIKVEREYALHVKCRAVQDEMPAGLEKLLGLLAA